MSKQYEYPCLQESLPPPEQRINSLNVYEISDEPLKQFKRAKTLRVRVLLVISIIAVILFVTSLLFGVKYFQSKSRVGDYSQQIEEYKEKYHVILTNRTFDLSYSNITSLKTILVTEMNLPLRLLNLSSNLITNLSGLSIFSQTLKTIDLRNNSIREISHCDFPFIDKIYFPSDIKIVDSNTFGFKQFPEQLKHVGIISDNIFTEMEQIIIEDTLMSLFSSNTLTKTKRIVINNTMIQTFTLAPTIPIDIYISSNAPEAEIITISINGKYAPFNLELSSRGVTSVNLASADYIDLSKINCPLLKRLVLEKGSVINFDRALEKLERLTLTNISGVSVFNLTNYPECTALTLQNVDVDQINFQPEHNNIRQIHIKNTSINGFRGLKSQSLLYLSLSGNQLLTEITENQIPKCETLIFPNTTLSITHNNFQRINRIATTDGEFECKLPLLFQISHNDFSLTENLTLSNGHLSEITNNTFRNVVSVMLDNNRLDDNAAMDLINNNIWDPEKVVFINLTNNMISNVQIIKDLVGEKLPNAELEI